jgi:hypothetical protein
MTFHKKIKFKEYPKIFQHFKDEKKGFMHVRKKSLIFQAKKSIDKSIGFTFLETQFLNKVVKQS